MSIIFPKSDNGPVAVRSALALELLRMQAAEDVARDSVSIARAEGLPIDGSLANLRLIQQQNEQRRQEMRAAL